MYFVVNGLFSYVNVSQGSVETYARSGGIFNKSFYCKFTKKSSSEKLWKSVKIWHNYGYEFGASFLVHSVKLQYQLTKSNSIQAQIQ